MKGCGEKWKKETGFGEGVKEGHTHQKKKTFPLLINPKALKRR